MSRAHKIAIAGAAVLVALVVAGVLAFTLLGDDEGEHQAGSQDLQACLAEQGVELPDGPPGAPPVDGEPPEGGAPADGGFPEGGELPDGGMPPEGGASSGVSEEARAAFEECAQAAPDGGQPMP
ncbi:hypothetical protein HJD18_03545 [Thermoleophilia bacterium SCSIO 60948]|nr:hypothetical protein HJD18_03545 [Thermoleophilia bacterium SCSIO 60948]